MLLKSNFGAWLNIFIIQHIVTLPKYGHGELNIRRPHTTDILRYICVIDQACSVKMAGYWPIFFFFCAFLWTSTSSRSIKTQKKTRPISSHLDRTSLVNKGFIVWLYLQVKTTTTKQNRTRNCSARKEIFYSRPV